MKKRNRYEDSKGNKIPGVTSVTGCMSKPALIGWAAKMTSEHVEKYWKPGKSYEADQIELVLQDAKNAHRRKKTEAGDFGSDIHALVESYIGGQITPEQVMDSDQRKALENFIKVTDGWEWLGAEIIVIHEDKKPLPKDKEPCLPYGGTADGIAKLPSGMIILSDVKTSTGVWPEMDLQVAMYCYAKPTDESLKEVWSKIEEARILHFDKTRNTWEILERDVKEQYKYIPHIRMTYEWKKQFASNWS